MIFVSSSCLTHNKISETITELAEAGIKNIELSGGTDYYCDIENDLDKLRKKYDLNYVCHSYFPPPKKHFAVNLASCNDEIYEASINHYRDCIKMLKRLNIGILSIHAGILVETKADDLGNKIVPKVLYDEDEAYDRFVNAYSFLQDMCNKNGIKLYLENHVLSAANYESFGNKNYFMMTDYQSVIKMKRKMKFNLLLDLAHLHVSCGSLGLPYADQCSKLIPMAEWFHVSENNGRIDQHLSLKEGSAICVQAMSVKDTEKNVTLETVGSIGGILNSKKIMENYNRSF